MQTHSVHATGSDYERRAKRQLYAVAVVTVVTLLLIAGFFLLWPL